MSVACGAYTSDPEGNGAAGGGAGGNGIGGNATAGGGAGGSGNGGSATGGGGAGGSGTGGSGTAGSGAQPTACDCSIRDCRPAPEVASDLCTDPSTDELVTYTEREGCDYVELAFDYNRGWRTYLYDDQWTLVAFALDNAFGGSLHCGVETSCTGSIVRQCRLCRGELFVDDDAPDCPATLWETAGGDGP